MIKNASKLWRKLFPHKVNDNMLKITRTEMLCSFLRMASLTLNTKLCSFTASWKTITSTQNFVKSSLFVELTKISCENRYEILVASFLLSNKALYILLKIREKKLKKPETNCTGNDILFSKMLKMATYLSLLDLNTDLELWGFIGLTNGDLKTRE